MEKYKEIQNISDRALKAFPSKILQEKYLKILIDKLKPKKIAQIIERQIFSERERYTVKKDVDDALLSSKIIKEKTLEIKSLCLNDNYYEREYLKLLHKDMSHLFEILIDFCLNYNEFKNDSNLFNQFLEKYIRVADIDNAHAMYLSSDNWSFSVFNRLLEDLENSSEDISNFHQLLKGGILDIRTVVFREAAKNVFNGSLEDYVLKLENENNIVKNHFWSPYLIFPFFDNKEKEISSKKDPQIYTAYNNKIWMRYIDLYHARYLFDAFEYFGMYGFVRNAIADLCNCLGRRNNDKKLINNANYITLYQFNFCRI